MAQDIWKYAYGRVDNKGIMARIGHSPKLHRYRSATTSKGSFGSKALGLLGVAGRAGLKAIPVPALGGLLGQIEQHVEKMVRSHIHKGRGKASKGASKADQVKFQLKELSVEELDRYRKKVEMAANDINKAVGSFEPRVKKKRAAHATCDAYLELAEAGEQATRRIVKLRTTCEALMKSLALTLEWANKMEHGHWGSDTPSPTSVNGFKNEASNVISGEIAAELALAEKAGTMMKMKEEFIVEYHGKCGQWCCFREAGKPDDWMTFKNNAAIATKFLSDPFSVDDIIGVGISINSANKAAADLEAAGG